MDFDQAFAEFCASDTAWLPPGEREQEESRVEIQESAARKLSAAKAREEARKERTRLEAQEIALRRLAQSKRLARNMVLLGAERLRSPLSLFSPLSG